MKTIQLTSLREMEAREVPTPTVLRDDDVLIRIRQVGVCGSDVHYYVNGRIGSQVVEYPFAVGHECAGIVEDAGDGVTDLSIGDPIAIDPAMPCGDCDQCNVGRSHTCRNLKFLGCPGQADGSLSEYIVMPRSSCFKLRPESPLVWGVLSEPLAIGVYACKLAGDLKGKNIGIFGSGPIGMSVLLPSRYMGASRVYATDKVENRLASMTAAGADWTGNPDSTDIVEELTAAEPELLDYVFECCGQQDAIDQALKLLKPGGTLMVIGIPEEERLSFSVDTMRRNEIRIQNVRRQNECTGETIRLMETGAIAADVMVTHHFDFDDTQEAFDLVAGYRDGVMKAIISIDE